MSKGEECVSRTVRRGSGAATRGVAMVLLKEAFVSRMAQRLNDATLRDVTMVLL